MNKKGGELAVTILVFLVLITCLSTLYLFLISKEKNKEEISRSFFARGVYFNAEVGEKYLRDYFNTAFIEAYYDKLFFNTYLAAVVANPQGEVIFGYGLKPDINNRFKMDFIMKFKKQTEVRYNFDYLNEIKEIIQEEKFDVDFDGKELKVGVREWEVGLKNDNLLIIHKPYINLSISFSEKGLASFNEILELHDKCKNSNAEEEKKCFENTGLKGFDVKVETKTGYNLVKFTSKEEFLINNKQDRINFGFVP